MGAVQFELAAGEALDVGGQAAGVAAVADERLGEADEGSAAGGEAQPEVPVLGDSHGGLEAAGLLERGAAQHHARGRDRVGLVEQGRELVALVQSGAQLGPALAGRSAVGADDQRAAEAGDGVGLVLERRDLESELAGKPGVVGVAERHERDGGAESRQAPKRARRRGRRTPRAARRGSSGRGPDARPAAAARRRRPRRPRTEPGPAPARSPASPPDTARSRAQERSRRPPVRQRSATFLALAGRPLQRVERRQRVEASTRKKRLAGGLARQVLLPTLFVGAAILCMLLAVALTFSQRAKMTQRALPAGAVRAGGQAALRRPRGRRHARRHPPRAEAAQRTPAPARRPPLLLALHDRQAALRRLALPHRRRPLPGDRLREGTATLAKNRSWLRYRTAAVTTNIRAPDALPAPLGHPPVGQGRLRRRHGARRAAEGRPRTAEPRPPPPPKPSPRATAPAPKASSPRRWSSNERRPGACSARSPCPVAASSRPRSRASSAAAATSAARAPATCTTASTSSPRPAPPSTPSTRARSPSSRASANRAATATSSASSTARTSPPATPT